MNKMQETIFQLFDELFGTLTKQKQPMTKK